jgi:hypothetical protein
MRIVGQVSERHFTLRDGRAVGIATTADHVVIEVQDLTNSIYIHASVEELERAILWCKTKASSVPCGCKNHEDGRSLPGEFTAEES